LKRAEVLERSGSREWEYWNNEEVLERSGSILEGRRSIPEES
jgi:hypothetical protein